MSDIEWTDEDDEPEWKPCLPVSCPDVEEETITFTAPPVLDAKAHTIYSELRSTLLGVPEGEQGVRLSPPSPPPAEDQYSE